MRDYDEGNIDSIYRYSKNLIGMTFNDVINNSNLSEKSKKEIKEKYGSYSNKGGLGNLLEEVYYGYAINGRQEADFKKVGVELKSTPYEINKNKSLRAGERLSVTMISYDEPVKNNFYESDLWHKIQLILLVYYLRDREKESRLDYKIDYSYLLKIPEKDLEIIKEDYKKIIDKIASGKAHELSEGDTLYLGACTKGSTAEKSARPQFYGEHIPAKKRSFCLKQSYMTSLLNNYIKPGIETYESVMSGIENYMNQYSFEENVINAINQYIGKSDYELCRMFSRTYNNNKAQWSDLTYRMLGIKSNNAEEFVKANIVVKAIRIEENGHIKENMSFPAFKYKELVKEEWEDSTLRNYFDETKFLFVVFKKIGDRYYLKGAQFWNMPLTDLDGEVYKGWQKVVDTIKDGVKFTIKKTTVNNNFLKKKDNKIVHVRPHAQKSYHVINGKVYGNGKMSDSNELPNGDRMTNYCFWLNNKYVLSFIKKEYLD